MAGTDYGTIHGDEDGLAWEISSTGVKAMTESDFLRHGEGQPARRRDPVSEKWAQAMTAKYGDLPGRAGVPGNSRAAWTWLSRRH